ncbi:MAG: response regulator [Planctomycetes bacterium]|nr:response regulator [Planctomycetota bacterium]
MARILVVDDDVNVASLVREILDDDGQEVTELHDPGAAFAAISGSRYDLLISDIAMPGEDGLSLLARMRSLGLVENIPVLFITAHVDDDYRRAAEVLGAADILAKPFTVDALLEAVHGLLETPIAPATAAALLVGEGDLSTISVLDTANLILLSGKTLLLSLIQSSNVADLFFRKGALVFAHLDFEDGRQLDGDEAFLETAGWKAGRFQLRAVEHTLPDNVQHALDALVVEAARRGIKTRHWKSAEGPAKG